MKDKYTEIVSILLFIFFHVKENKPKENNQCHGGFLRVADTAGARGNSPACGGLRQSARFFRPYRRCSAP
jgi:hypothetical protein